LTWPGSRRSIAPMRKAALAKVWAKVSRVRAVVVGDPCLDENVAGRTAGLAREAPVLALDADAASFAPGQATNVAVNAAALGARVAFFGLAGDDEHRARLAALLRGRGVDAGGLWPEDGRRTTYKVKFVSRESQRHAQHLFHCYYEDRHPAAAAVRRRLREAVGAALADADVLILSDYGNGTLDRSLVTALIAGARRRRLISVANTRGELSAFRGVGGAVVNAAEWAALTGRPWPAGDAAAIARLLAAGARALACRAVVVTAGAEGMYYWPAGEKNRRAGFLRPVAPYVADVTGAGDTATAAFGVALGAGMRPSAAAAFANLAAAAVVIQPGTAFPRRAAMEKLAFG